MKTKLLLALSGAVVLAACSNNGAASRDQIRVVGSSTVYPFAQAVAEQFVKANAGFKSPIVESTGTGAGMKLFCAGVGAQHPDVEMASRRIKASEYQDCVKNGVKDVVELQVGIDGISFGEAQGGPQIRLTTEDVYKALAARPYGKEQTAKLWRDVNAALPAIPILVYGPPSTSGTRDALAELIMTKGCDANAEMKALKASNEAEHKKVCTGVREDGAYVDAGENDNLIVQKIAANPNAIGIFGFSFLEENRDKLKDVPLNGVEATYETISNFSYPGARPLYIYIKSAHVRAIPGLREFVAEWGKAMQPNGYLKARGMIVAPADVLARSGTIARDLTLLNGGELK